MLGAVAVDGHDALNACCAVFAEAAVQRQCLSVGRCDVGAEWRNVCLRAGCHHSPCAVVVKDICSLQCGVAIRQAAQCALQLVAADGCRLYHVAAEAYVLLAGVLPAVNLLVCERGNGHFISFRRNRVDDGGLNIPHRHVMGRAHQIGCICLGLALYLVELQCVAVHACQRIELRAKAWCEGQT